MKKIIVKAIAKASKTNAKTAHIPFYKGITTTTPTTATPTTATTTAKDVYNFVLRYTVEMYPAVKPYGDEFMQTAKAFYADLEELEQLNIIDTLSAMAYVYKFLWMFFNVLSQTRYAWNINDDITMFRRHKVINALSTDYFNRYMEEMED